MQTSLSCGRILVELNRRRGRSSNSFLCACPGSADARAVARWLSAERGHAVRLTIISVRTSRRRCRMSALRDRMIRDMTVRGFSPRTHESYIQQVIGLARYYRRPPDQLSADEVQTYLAMLFNERKRSWSTCAQAAHAFRFLYHVTLGRPRAEFRVPAPKQPQKLPEILSRQEVWRLLAACEPPRAP